MADYLLQKFLYEMERQRERNGRNPNKWISDIARDFRLNKKDVRKVLKEVNRH